MSAVVYTFQKGETIVLALDAVEGDPATVTQITAKIRQQTSPFMQAEFDVVSRAGGWTLTIDPTTSSGLLAGLYQATATITVPGQTIITEPVQVRLQ